MMGRLWFKLIGAFALVILVGITVTVVLARQGAATQFTHFMLGNRMVDPQDLQSFLADYYRQQGSWQDVDAVLGQAVYPTSERGMGEMMGGMMGVASGRILLVSSQGEIVSDSAGVGMDAATDWGHSPAWPIMVGGEQVGTLIVEGPVMTLPNSQGAALLAGVTQAVLFAGLVAGAVALLLGGILIRQITRPLGALEQASQRIAAGDLSVRVAVQGRDELGELAETFNFMTAHLQTQEDLRRNLMADVAHELRTPISGIQGMVEALQDGVFPLTPQNLEPIHEQAVLLSRLVEDLRNLAHGEAGQLALNRAPLDLAELTQSQLAHIRPQALAKNVALHLQVPENLPTLQADGRRLGQAFANLLSNALRHTPAGGEVQVRLQAVEGGIQLSVLDSGEGIPESELPHLFDRFYRTDRSRSRETGGSGLGLAIVRQFIEAHGGRVWAESPPSEQTQGSAFHLFLPNG